MNKVHFVHDPIPRNENDFLSNEMFAESKKVEHQTNDESFENMESVKDNDDESSSKNICDIRRFGADTQKDLQRHAKTHINPNLDLEDIISVHTYIGGKKDVNTEDSANLKAPINIFSTALATTTTFKDDIRNVSGTVDVQSNQEEAQKIKGATKQIPEPER